MGKLTLVTGGARSGKSIFAEEIAKKLGDNIVYVATSIPFDDEMKLRIKKHREQRPSHWQTIEVYKDMDVNLKNKLEGKDAVLLDCLTIMITNIMLEQHEDWENIKSDEIQRVEKVVNNEVKKLLNVIAQSPIPFIIVTNETGMGVVPAYASARAFRDFEGRANQMVAKAAQDVYLCVAGIPVKIK